MKTQIQLEDERVRFLHERIRIDLPFTLRNLNEARRRGTYRKAVPDPFSLRASELPRSMRLVDTSKNGLYLQAQDVDEIAVIWLVKPSIDEQQHVVLCRQIQEVLEVGAVPAQPRRINREDD